MFHQLLRQQSNDLVLVLQEMFHQLIRQQFNKLMLGKKEMFHQLIRQQSNGPMLAWQQKAAAERGKQQRRQLPPLQQRRGCALAALLDRTVSKPVQ